MCAFLLRFRQQKQKRKYWYTKKCSITERTILQNRDLRSYPQNFFNYTRISIYSLCILSVYMFSISISCIIFWYLSKTCVAHLTIIRRLNTQSERTWYAHSYKNIGVTHSTDRKSVSRFSNRPILRSFVRVLCINTIVVTARLMDRLLTKLFMHA